MKNNFKTICIAIIAFILGSATVVLANQAIQAIQNTQIKVSLNGEIQEFKDETTGETQYPITYNDRTYLPLRNIAELSGLKVDYDNETNTAILEQYQSDIRTVKQEGINKYILVPVDSTIGAGGPNIIVYYSNDGELNKIGMFHSPEDFGYWIKDDEIYTNCIYFLKEAVPLTKYQLTENELKEISLYDNEEYLNKEYTINYAEWLTVEDEEGNKIIKENARIIEEGEKVTLIKIVRDDSVNNHTKCTIQKSDGTIITVY